MVPSGMIGVQSTIAPVVPPPPSADVLYDGLTPTLYAAPTAQGTGSGTTEANAMALETAVATAPSGAIIGCLPGVYARSRPGTDDRWLPIYFLENSGTPGAPTTVVGKYDPLIYYADAAKRCEIQNTAASLVSPWNDPGNRAGIGCYARSYQRWINFYLNTSNVPSYPDRGSVVCNDAHNCTFRKIVFNRTLGYNGLDNYDCVFAQASNNLRIEYCYAYGHVGTIHRNIAVVKCYSCTNFSFQYNTFANVCQGFFIKGDVLGSGQSGDISYNKGTGCVSSFIDVGVVRSASGSGNVVTVHHNLGVGNAIDFWFESSGDSGVTNDNRRVYKNTFVDATQGGAYSNDSTLISEQWYDNVVAFMSATSAYAFNMESGSAAGFTTMDRNLYYEAGGTVQFANGGVVYSGLPAWRTQTGKEANSSVGDPVFDNAAGGNYRRTASGDTASSTGGKRGCYETGSEQIGAF